MAAMNYCFFKAIERIPLGVAVAIEFSGPLTAAALTSKKFSHLGWVALAAVGIVVLTPLSGAELDPSGVLFAMLSGVGWGFFAVLSRQVSEKVHNNDGLVIGMTIAALLMLPVLSSVPVLLSERVGARGLIAVVCVVVAAIGVSISDARDTKRQSTQLPK